MSPLKDLNISNSWKQYSICGSTSDFIKMDPDVR